MEKIVHAANKMMKNNILNSCQDTLNGKHILGLVASISNKKRDNYLVLSKQQP
jgi:hypothetical protein